MRCPARLSINGHVNAAPSASASIIRPVNNVSWSGHAHWAAAETSRGDSPGTPGCGLNYLPASATRPPQGDMTYRRYDRHTTSNLL